jgi:uncharacterized protein (DUF486 family)
MLAYFYLSSHHRLWRESHLPDLCDVNEISDKITLTYIRNHKSHKWFGHLATDSISKAIADTLWWSPLGWETPEFYLIIVVLKSIGFISLTVENKLKTNHRVMTLLNIKVNYLKQCLNLNVWNAYQINFCIYI